MNSIHKNDFDLLNRQGLNMQAVFDLSALPEDIVAAISQEIDDVGRFSQLILIGHGGQDMWEQVQQTHLGAEEHPIDVFSADMVRRFFAKAMPDASYEIIFPGLERIVPLQRLGELAGWHHASPFRVGINGLWGSWFAYRAVILADTNLQTTKPWAQTSPCDPCKTKTCLTSCHVADHECGDIPIQSCIDYRLRDDSRCKEQCHSRLACPVGMEHRYSSEQVNYHYALSMKTIEDYDSGTTRQE